MNRTSYPDDDESYWALLPLFDAELIARELDTLDHLDGLRRLSSTRKRLSYRQATSLTMFEARETFARALRDAIDADEPVDLTAIAENAAPAHHRALLQELALGDSRLHQHLNRLDITLGFAIEA